MFQWWLSGQLETIAETQLVHHAVYLEFTPAVCNGVWQISINHFADLRWNHNKVTSNTFDHSLASSAHLHLNALLPHFQCF